MAWFRPSLLPLAYPATIRSASASTDLAVNEKNTIGTTFPSGHTATATGRVGFIRFRSGKAV